MDVSGVIEANGFYTRLGIKHIGGKIYPDYGERHKSVDLLLYRNMENILIAPSSFMNDVDALDRIMDTLEGMGAKIMRCSTSLPSETTNGEVGYHLELNSTGFDIKYSRPKLMLLELREA